MASKCEIGTPTQGRAAIRHPSFQTLFLVISHNHHQVGPPRRVHHRHYNYHHQQQRHVHGCHECHECHVWRGVTLLDRQAFQGGYVPKAQAQIPSTPRGLELKGPFGHESPVVCMLRKRFTQFDVLCPMWMRWKVCKVRRYSIPPLLTVCQLKVVFI